jgi:hypothetical protein
MPSLRATPLWPGPTGSRTSSERTSPKRAILSGRRTALGIQATGSGLTAEPAQAPSAQAQENDCADDAGATGHRHRRPVQAGEAPFRGKVGLDHPRQVLQPHGTDGGGGRYGIVLKWDGGSAGQPTRPLHDIFHGQSPRSSLWDTC